MALVEQETVENLISHVNHIRIHNENDEDDDYFEGFDEEDDLDADCFASSDAKSEQDILNNLREDECVAKLWEEVERSVKTAIEYKEGPWCRKEPRLDAPCTYPATLTPEMSGDATYDGIMSSDPGTYVLPENYEATIERLSTRIKPLRMIFHELFEQDKPLLERQLADRGYIDTARLEDVDEHSLKSRSIQLFLDAPNEAAISELEGMFVSLQTSDTGPPGRPVAGFVRLTEGDWDFFNREYVEEDRTVVKYDLCCDALARFDAALRDHPEQLLVPAPIQPGSSSDEKTDHAALRSASLLQERISSSALELLCDSVPEIEAYYVGRAVQLVESPIVWSLSNSVGLTRVGEDFLGEGSKTLVRDENVNATVRGVFGRCWGP